MGRADIAIGSSAIQGVPMHGPGKAGGAAALMLRPERLSLTRGQGGLGGANLAATVTDITFLGSNIHIAAAAETGEVLSVRLPFGHEAASRISRGDAVTLGFDPASAHVFVAA